MPTKMDPGVAGSVASVELGSVSTFAFSVDVYLGAGMSNDTSLLGGGAVSKY